jgi:hypothetical protein
MGGSLRHFADCFRLASFYYTHGKELTEVIWRETMEELKSMGVVEVLESLQKSQTL